MSNEAGREQWVDALTPRGTGRHRRNDQAGGPNLGVLIAGHDAARVGGQLAVPPEPLGMSGIGRAQQQPQEPDDQDAPITEPLEISGQISMAAIRRELAERAAAAAAAPEPTSQEQTSVAPVPGAPAVSDAFVFPETTPVYHRQRMLRIAAIGVAVLLIVAGVAWWTLGRSRAPEPPPPHQHSAADSTLEAALPKGYAAGVCNAVTPPTGALAQIVCGPNTAPGGPASATYTLYGNAADLDAGLAEIERSVTAVLCPGNIQSPGPWHRGAPNEPLGILLCGHVNNVPTLVWSNNGARIITQVTDAGGLGRLNTWWQQHA